MERSQWKAYERWCSGSPQLYPPVLPGSLFLFRKDSLGMRLHGIMEHLENLEQPRTVYLHNLYITRYRSRAQGAPHAGTLVVSLASQPHSILQRRSLPPRANTGSDRQCGTEWGWLVRLPCSWDPCCWKRRDLFHVFEVNCCEIVMNHHFELRIDLRSITTLTKLPLHFSTSSSTVIWNTVPTVTGSAVITTPLHQFLSGFTRSATTLFSDSLILLPCLRWRAAGWLDQFMSLKSATCTAGCFWSAISNSVVSSGSRWRGRGFL